VVHRPGNFTDLSRWSPAAKDHGQKSLERPETIKCSVQSQTELHIRERKAEPRSGPHS
jgi:hypothetical protein